MSSMVTALTGALDPRSQEMSQRWGPRVPFKVAPIWKAERQTGKEGATVAKPQLAKSALCFGPHTRSPALALALARLPGFYQWSAAGKEPGAQLSRGAV